MHNFKFVFLISVHQLLWLITAGAYELLKAASYSMQLLLSAGCHHNPNPSLFMHKESNTLLCEAWIVCNCKTAMAEDYLESLCASAAHVSPDICIWYTFYCFSWIDV